MNRATEHIDYPHWPGQLYDCPACEEGPCTCDETGNGYCVSKECQAWPEDPCGWFAKCDNAANQLRHHPILGFLPICDRCNDKAERLSNANRQVRKDQAR